MSYVSQSIYWVSLWFLAQPGELLLSNEIIGHLELVKAFSQDAHVIKRETNIKVRICTVNNSLVSWALNAPTDWAIGYLQGGCADGGRMMFVYI